ncbi:MAG: glutaredoxin family protein [Hydrogenophaga sp.]
MTFAPIRRLLLATALLSAVQAHAQLDDLFRNPGSPAPAPVEREPRPASANTRPAAAEPAVVSSPAPATDDRVVIYTTPTCPHCHRALKHMQARNIPYLQKDVQHNAENRAEFKRIGGRGVPHILIGDQVMVGFSPQGFDQRHKAWKAGASTVR